MIKQVCILYNQKEATHYKERIETLVNQNSEKYGFRVHGSVLTILNYPS